MVITICFFLFSNAFGQLDDQPENYVNYESAVNPEYYDQHYKNGILRYPSGPTVHIKQGLSKPEEKIFYQGLENETLKIFLVDLKSKLCDGTANCKYSEYFLNLLEEYNSPSKDIQQKLYDALREHSITKGINRVIDVYKRYFDIGYCGYHLLNGMTYDLKQIKGMADKCDTKETSRVIAKIKEYINDYDEYKLKCIK